MYQIFFNTQSAQWEIRIHRGFYIWKTISSLSFDTYENARLHVGHVGIDKVYAGYTWAIKNPPGTIRDYPA